MERYFSVFHLADAEEDIPVKVPFRKILSQNYVERVRDKKILNKVPLQIKPMEVIGIEGNKVQLPITASIIKEKDENYIKTILESSIQRLVDEETNIFVMPTELNHYIKELDVLVADGRPLSFLYMDQIINRCVKYHSKTLKEIHFVIIDGQDSLTEYCIDLIYQQVNYLTIITKRPEYFDEIVDMIYEETGLAVEIIKEPLLEYIESDIIINCNREKSKAFFFFNKQAYFIDFFSEREEVRNILLKRKDLQVIDDVSFKIGNEAYDSKLLQAAIFSRNRVLRGWMLYGYKKDMLDRIKRTLSQYTIELHHFYQFGRRL